MTWAWRGLGATALGLLVLAALAAVRPYPGWWGTAADGPDPPLVIDAERDLGVVGLGESVVHFSITNPGSRPRRVVGFRESCRVNCLSAEIPDQVTLPAGEVFHYPCRLRVRSPGPFEVEMALLVEDNGIREVTLTARGTGVAPEKRDDPKPSP